MLVINALPNYLHAPVTISLLQCGKHVLCEKPMAMTVLQAEAMAATADAARRKLMIAHVWRSNAEVQWLREIVRAGAVGTVNKVKAHAIVAGRGPKLDSWFVRPELAGGGALADVGIHVIDTISFLFDDRLNPVNVTASTANRQRSLDVEDTAKRDDRVRQWNRGRGRSGLVSACMSVIRTARSSCLEPAGYAHAAARTWSIVGDDVRRESVPSFSAERSHIDLPMYAAQIDHFLDCILEDRQAIVRRTARGCVT